LGLIGALTLFGFALRWHQFSLSFLGDELSTLWIVKHHSLSGTIDVVKSDAEITPPLFFVLAWLASKISSAPEMIRVPSLIAGTVSIPLVYRLGQRTIGVTAGLLATVIFTLSPFLTYFSGNGRAYSVMILLLIGSTLAMLAGARTGRTRWWVVYGICTCLAVYTHYTVLFVLFGQLAWLLWAHKAARRPALIASGVAALLFLPWLTGLTSDLDSPTTDILAALQGTGFTAKRIAVEQWAFGHALFEPDIVPGKTAILLSSVGLLVALVATIARGFRRFGPSIGETARSIPEGVVLVLIIALATPVGEAILGLVGTDLLGSRNMTASWYGLALSIGALLVAAGPVWGVISAVLVISGFGIGAGKMLGDEASTTDFRGGAEFIDARARPGDVVVDAFSAAVTPVPEPPLDLYLSGELPEYRINLPTSPPPYLPYQETVPAPDPMLKRAFRKARQGRVFLFKPGVLRVIPNGDTDEPIWTGRQVILPEWAEVEEVEELPSRDSPSIYVISGKSSRSQ
jgi:hypothetical protein